MEKTAYRIPVSITISRKTGQVTNMEWIDNATLEEFLPVYDWMKEAGETVMEARRQKLTERGESSPSDFAAGCATRQDCQTASF